MEKSLQALNHQEKIAVWSEQIAACRSSGISVRAWCEGNGISTASYYKWQKKLFSLAAQNAPQFAEVCVAPAALTDVIPEGTPVEVVEHPLPEHERVCGVCGARQKILCKRFSTNSRISHLQCA